jgi:PAS domain S-box-containing protein
LTYDSVVLEISRPLDETILSQIPAAILVLRASDQMIVFANDTALQASGYSTSDFGKVSLWDLVVEEDSKRVADEASKIPARRPADNSDQSEGFVRVRTKSGTELDCWFTIKDIVDADGLVRFRTILGFVNYDKQADDDHKRAKIVNTIELGLRRSSGLIASEINNALAVLQIALDSKNLLSADESLEKALAPLNAIGERLCRFGSGLEAPNNQPLPAADTGSTLLHPRTAAALLFPRVLIVDDDLQLLEALQELLYLNGVSAIQSISTKQALEFAHLFLPEIALIDLRLGHEDGRDTAKLLLETFPSMKIVFMTGYADSLHVIEHEGKFPVLKKPFAIDSLIALIGNKVST